MTKPTNSETVKTHRRICPFCEQNCATLVTVDHALGQVLDVRGDKEDPLSKGFVCPKAVAIKDLHHDPDRLRGPVVRRNGRFEPIGWDEAFDLAADRLQAIQRRHGRNAVGCYAGTSIGHVQSIALYSATLLMTLGSTQIFSSASVDCHPHFLVATAMFGALSSLPVPDIDRCDYLVVIGANPYQSNGSFLTAPNIPARMRALQARGGKIVVIDPRRTETAAAADWHLPIEPSGDAALLLAIVHVLFDEGRVNLRHIEPYARNIEHLQRLARPFTPDHVSAATGIDADDIRRLARALSDADRGCVYGRLGSSMQSFGSLTNWLINAVNALTGNLDRIGGAMFANPVFDPVILAQRHADGSIPFARYHSRVGGLPELAGQFPAGAMIDEIETPGDGQIKALITLGANPVLSSANGGGKLTRALEKLEFMLSFDIYINETTRHADLILPSPSQLSHADFMLFYAMFAVRGYTKFAAPVFDLQPDERLDNEVICEIVSRISGISRQQADENTLRMVFDQLRAQGQPVLSAMSFDQLLQQVGREEGVERIFDMLLRAGQYGDHFGERPEGLTLAKLKAHGAAMDFGPLKPRIAEMIHLPDGKIDFAPDMLVADLARLEAWLKEDRSDQLLLVGRRQVRSCNTWMHNFPSLAKGPNLCVLLINPEDARQHGIADGAQVVVRSAQGRINVPAKVTDEMRRGVVSLPHGWGHDDPEVPGQPYAKARAGMNYNLLADERRVDEPSGNLNLNYIPVEILPFSGDVAASAARAV